MISSKIVTIWAKAFLLTINGKTESEKTKVIKKLIEILRRKKKERFLASILEKAEKMSVRKNTIDLILARLQGRALTDKIEKKLREKFGESKEIKVRTDPTIISGFRAKTGDLLIRASVKDFLNQIKNKTKWSD